MVVSGPRRYSGANVKGQLVGYGRFRFAPVVFEPGRVSIAVRGFGNGVGFGNGRFVLVSLPV